MLVVGAVVRETMAATMRFVSWYMEQGASRIVLCFDDPSDPAILLLSKVPNVTCLPCTPEYWASVGVAPDARFTQRQNAAMDSIYRALPEGWFLNVDADEFVYLKGRKLVDELGQVPDDVRSVTIRPAENIQAGHETDVLHFRLPMPTPVLRQVYGDHAAMMRRRQGLTGHNLGKSVTRAGLQNFKMRQHFLQCLSGAPIMDSVIGHDEGAYLLHFFDQGYELWRAKLPWRMSSSGFTHKAKVILSNILKGPEPEAALRSVYDNLHVFPQDRLSVLEQSSSYLKLKTKNGGLLRLFAPQNELYAGKKA